VRIEEAMVRESRKIDSIFKIKSECDAHETGTVPEPPEETHVQPPLLLLKFGQETHEEQGHQSHRNEVFFRGIEFVVSQNDIRFQHAPMYFGIVSSCCCHIIWHSKKNMAISSFAPHPEIWFKLHHCFFGLFE
jgi:hypothetical protein